MHPRALLLCRATRTHSMPTAVSPGLQTAAPRSAGLRVPPSTSTACAVRRQHLRRGGPRPAYSSSERRRRCIRGSAARGPFLWGSPPLSENTPQHSLLPTSTPPARRPPRASAPAQATTPPPTSAGERATPLRRREMAAPRACDLCWVAASRRRGLAVATVASSQPPIQPTTLPPAHPPNQPTASPQCL